MKGLKSTDKVDSETALEIDDPVQLRPQQIRSGVLLDELGEGHVDTYPQSVSVEAVANHVPVPREGPIPGITHDRELEVLAVLGFADSGCDAPVPGSLDRVHDPHRNL